MTQKTIRLYVALTAVVLLTACSTSRNMTRLYSVQKGEMIVLKHPCNFIDNSGQDNLLPVGKRELLPDERSRTAGVVEQGTRVEFLGAFAESGFMADTRIELYGRIADGPFRRRKVSLNEVMRWQSEESNDALIRIEREVFSIK